MKKLLRSALVLTSILITTAEAKAADTYTLDPMHTSVTWTINHFGFSNPWGKFSMITGELVLDEASPQKSQLSVTVPVSNLTTGIDKLDEHLRGDQFFNLEAFPTATFVSSKVKVTGKSTATVDGTLTLLGVAKPETLYVTLNKIGDNMMHKHTAGFSATATVKRSDFGMNAYLPGLGDDVKLYIEAEANL